MSATPLPNFFIAGAGKAGTTSLHHYLSQHPDVFMSRIKEPCYFASEIRRAALTAPMQRHVDTQSRAGGMNWLPCDWQEYLDLFRDASAKAIGEASAAYLWSETAAANIHARLPEARIVIMLRDPAERAFSQYLHQLSVGLTRATFREHLDACLGAPRTELGIHYPFLEIGLYSAQVKRFLDRFPREHIRIYWYEEAWQRPDLLLADLFQFLGVDSSFRADTAIQSHARRAPRWPALHYLLKRASLWYPLRALIPATLRGRLRGVAFRSGNALAMEPADRRFLIDYYRADIEALAALLDHDLTHWLSATPPIVRAPPPGSDNTAATMERSPAR